MRDDGLRSARSGAPKEALKLSSNSRSVLTDIGSPGALVWGFGFRVGLLEFGWGIRIAGTRGEWGRGWERRVFWVGAQGEKFSFKCLVFLVWS